MEQLEVCCAVIVRDRSVLATRRSKDMPHPLKWEFPGGKIKEGESPQACIIREIREELGVNIRVLDILSPLVHQYPGRSVRLLPLHCEISEAEETKEIVLAEHCEWQWVECRDLDGVDWLEADLGVVEQLRKKFC